MRDPNPLSRRPSFGHLADRSKEWISFFDHPRHWMEMEKMGRGGRRQRERQRREERKHWEIIRAACYRTGKGYWVEDDKPLPPGGFSVCVCRATDDHPSYTWYPTFEMAFSGLEEIARDAQSEVRGTSVDLTEPGPGMKEGAAWITRNR